MSTIMARKLVGRGFPPEVGAQLAESIMGSGEVQWESMTIDTTGLPASLLISAFFNGFLQRVHEKDPAALEAARKVKWVLTFQFQTDNVAKWAVDFRPVDASSTGSTKS